jgi:hypothetical protein
LEFLGRLTSRLGSGATAVMVTSTEPIDLAPRLTLGALTERELSDLIPGLSADAVHALWLASAGWPGAALDLAADLGTADTDAVIDLALTTPSRAEFLTLDVGLIRLLESAATRIVPPATRARLIARLARELLGDPSAAKRRRQLIDEAVTLARMVGDPATTAAVLDCRLHALWDPAAVVDRLTTASEIVEHGRAAGDAAVERRGLFWRFTALAEMGDLDAAEAALAGYARAGELDGDAEAAVVVLARQAMLATIRGRFHLAEKLTAEMADRGHRAGLSDTDRLVASLNGRLATLRGDVASQVEVLQTLARRLPGHFFEATAARALAESGREAEATLELDRLMPAVLGGSGPRWVGALADLAMVASGRGERPDAQALYDALYPFRGRLVVWGGANTITGPVDDYLGRLAARLGRSMDAAEHFDHAIDLEQRLGALPWLASTLTARARDDDLQRARSIAVQLGLGGALVARTLAGGEWRLSRDGDGWRLDAGAETARLRDGRGFEYLRTLLAAPGHEFAALDLVAGGSGLRAPAGEPVIDAAARAAFQHRLRVLEQQLDAADRSGDSEHAAVVHAERAALMAELRRAIGLGGRPRRQSSEAERARVSATRALWAVVDRIESVAPLAGAHLRSSLRTGHYLRYQPAGAGPRRWQV